MAVVQIWARMDDRDGVGSSQAAFALATLPEGCGNLSELSEGCEISVVIPVFNRQQLGERAVLSACAQAIDQMEVIVVDDGSNPPFQMPVIQPPDVNVRLIRHSVNSGASAARNSGIIAARGEWIALLDSDDYWIPFTLRARLDFAKQASESSNAATAWAAGFIVKTNTSALSDVRIPREAATSEEFACGCWFAAGSTILFRKEIFELVGPWDEELVRLEDYDWFLRFALAGGCLKVWNRIAAIVEVEGKPAAAVLETAARRLLSKYAGDDGWQMLTRGLTRRLRAYLDVERASIRWHRGQWTKMMFYLGRSFLRVPRRTIHLRRFWINGDQSRADEKSTEHLAMRQAGGTKQNCRPASGKSRESRSRSVGDSAGGRRMGLG
jgi:glycosyltransferase involved in cell wall biosynthesis